MAVDVRGLVVLLVFYLVIIVVGILAARFKRKRNGSSRMEEAIVAGRDINVVVGIFTMTGKDQGLVSSITFEGLEKIPHNVW